MIYGSAVKKSAVWTCYDAKLLHEIIRINVLLISLSHLFLLPFSPFLPPLRHLILCGPPSLFLSPIPCPFIITPSLPLVSWLAGSRWRGREGGRDVGKEGWRIGGVGGLLSSVPLFIPSQCRQTVCFHTSHSQTVHGSVSVGRCGFLRLTWRMKCLVLENKSNIAHSLIYLQRPTTNCPVILNMCNTLFWALFECTMTRWCHSHACCDNQSHSWDLAACSNSTVGYNVQQTLQWFCYLLIMFAKLCQISLMPI